MMTRRTWQKKEWLSLAGILVLTLFLRLAWLDRVPPGVRYDELLNVRMVDRIYAREWPIYFQESWGHEPLYHYIQAVTMALGKTVFGARMASVLLGGLGVFTAYLAIRQLCGPAVALVAATLLTTSFWSLMLSRFGLRIIGVAPWAGMAAYSFWRGLETPPPIKLRTPQLKTQNLSNLGTPMLWFALCGLCMGAMIYTYFAGWMMPLFLGVFTLYLLVFHRSMLKGRWAGTILCFVLPALMFTPLAIYLARHPESRQRVGQVGSKLIEAFRTQDLAPLLRNAWKTLGMFSHKGDPEWLYNISGRPVFDPVTAVLFYGGVLMSLWRWRDPKRAFILLWLVMGIAPTTITWPAGSLPHSIVAQPATFVFPALFMVKGWEWGAQIRVKWMRWGMMVLVIVVSAFGVVINGYDYFVRWPTFAQVRHEYQAPVAAVARYLQADAETTPACVSAPYVDYWHPWSEMSFDLLFRRNDVRVCWFNGSDSILFPAADQVRFFLPDHIRNPSDLDADLRSLLMEGSVPVELGYRDAGGSTFDLYRWQDRTPLDRFLASCASAPAWISPEGPYVAGESEKQRRAVALPLDFGHRLALLGYVYDQTQVAPGQTWRMMSCWRVLDRGNGDPLAIFVHVLDESNQVRASQDGLHVSTTSWREGDVFIQIHTMALASDLPAGTQRVELGLYSPATLDRLPLFTGQSAEIAGQSAEIAPQSRALLQPLNVE
jgi:4-amino-4-deoxy-L-arabinose transferase-like glycosyltransferase